MTLTRPAALATLTLAALLSGCGNGTGATEPGGADEPESTPACSEVWQAGETLPATYGGCEDDEGTFVEAAVTECPAGSENEDYVTYESLAAAAGGEIQQGADEATLCG